MSIGMMVFVGVMILFVVAVIVQANKHSTPPSVNSETIPLQTVISSDYYNPIDVHVFQLLESTWVMANSKVLDTVSGRYSFSLSKLEPLQQHKANERYLMDVQQGLDRYRSVYSDKPFMEYQQQLLMEPSFEKLNELYCVCITKCMALYGQDEIDHINMLKQPKARARRIQNLILKFNGAEEEMKAHCERSQNYSVENEKLRKLSDVVESMEAVV